MAIDSHAHYNLELTDNLDSMVKRIEESNDIEAVINVAMDIKTSIEITSLSQKYNKFYNTIGIHPLRMDSVLDLYTLYQSVDNSKIVGIGETGLDSNALNFNEQKRLLVEQIALANELQLPIVIHALNYNQEVLNVFKCNRPLYGYVFHCFQPDVEIANEIVRNGGYISIGGPVTYKTARKSIEVLKSLPLDYVLVETDSPYMAPEPLRNTINNSFKLQYIIQKIAEIKNLEYGKIEEITSANVKRLFSKMK